MGSFWAGRRSGSSARGRGSRRRAAWHVAIAVGVAVSAGLAGSAVPAAATATGQGRAARAAVTEAQTEAAAVAAAVASGQRVEVLAARTEWSQTFALPSGRLVLEQSMRPQRAQRADKSWAPIDTRLRRTVDGSLVPGATVYPVAFSGGGAGPLARIRNAGAELAVSWTGSLPPPVVDGSAATYPNVLPGVDLRVTATPLGFDQLLVVKTAAAAADPRLARIDFGLAASGTGLTITSAGGGAEVRNDKGEVVFAAPAPLMWDASGEAAPVPPGGTSGLPYQKGPLEGARTALMGMQVSSSTLTVIPDQNMLKDPDLKLPLFLDPSFSGGKVNGNEWTSVWSKYPNSSFWNNATALNNGSTKGSAGVGRTKDCSTCATYVIRSMFRMDIGGVHGKIIFNAKFRIQQRWSWTCIPSYGARVWRMSNHPVPSTTWNNQPAWGGGVSGLVGANHKYGATSGCANVGDVEFDVTPMVQSAAASWHSISLGLMAVDEGTVNAWKRYNHDSPRLVVEYNTVPSAAAAADLATRAETTSPDQPCATGTGRPLVRSTAPWLRARLTDPDGANGGQLRGTFAWQRWDGSAWVAMAGSPRASGLVAPNEPATIQLTEGMVDGGVYRWQVQTSDTLTGVSGWSPWCEFQLDSAPPGARPTVTSADGVYLESPGNPARRGGIGRSGRFTFGANGVTDIKDYVYKLENGPELVATPTTQGGSVTVWVTPTHLDENVLHVWSRDAAGNRSADPYDYWFRVDVAAGPVARWKLDEGAGTNLASAGGGPAATLTTGTGVWSQGRVIAGGAAIDLDAGAYASTAVPVVDTATAFSVAAWVRLDAISGYHTAVAQHGATGTSFELQYHVNLAKWCFTMWHTEWRPGEAWPAGSHACATAPVRTGVWTHLAAVYDPGAAKQLTLYVNGVRDGDASVPAAWNAAGALSIGRAYWTGSGAEWNGAIDDVRVWNRVVYPDLDLRDLAAPVRVGQWDLEDWGPVAADGSGFNHHGTLTPAPTAEWTTEGHNFTSAVHFDGGSGAIATAGPVVRTDQSFTVSAWVKLGGVPNRSYTVVSQDGDDKGGFFLGARMVNGVPKWSFMMPTTDTDAPGSVQADGPPVTAADTDRFVHLAGVYDAQAQTLRVYVDGTPSAPTGRAARWHAGGGLQIARALWTEPGAPTGHWDYVHGTVDKVRAYAGALTDTQVLDLLLNEP